MPLAEFDPDQPVKFETLADFHVAFFDMFEGIADFSDLDHRFKEVGPISAYQPSGAVMNAVRRVPSMLRRDVMPGDYFIVARPDCHFMWRYTVEPGTILGFVGSYNNSNFKIDIDPFGERVRTYRSAIFMDELEFDDNPVESEDCDLSEYFTADREAVDA